MQISKDDVRAAAQAGLIAPDQLAPLLAFLAARQAGGASGPRFDMVHLLWYAGTLLVISAMGLFSTLAFSAMGGAALTATALIYAAAFLGAGHYLWHRKGLRTPGGLLIAVAVAMAPLAVFGVQDAFGMWTDFGKPKAMRDFYIWIKGSFVFMELATIAAALLALRFYRFPFIVLLMAVALWFMSMDIVPWITGAPFGNWEASRRVSVGFGLAMLVIALIVNGRQRRGDFAFWLYLFGALTFWGGITASSSGSDVDKALYCAMNVGFLVISVVLARRVFAVFGVIGIAIYLGDLADRLFKDSLLFPFALSLIGIGIIALGLYSNRHQAAIGAWVAARLPEAVKRLRPA
ncbi:MULTISPECIES: hypothetical protein [Rhodopseudomonas]|uniref:DUF2157 domain-containing protein n=1 Tax=Rhodopseudomonas palustris TaxID=1076 RepID=A0A0D7DZM3_RHOPL|nr:MULTISPECIES: hypothetical protein [Rhodopseudomonas]KIZ34033.1 hypothetical protein OO17_27480 [Rhodopseudomonas palustris]MDF3809862.1 hypothetical protein [Rhodopseudomonas sp. BAL398]WOK15536.1 hypothetical protein RBJ75_15210 [Rhodopseudomonas sp. BAL398]